MAENRASPGRQRLIEATLDSLAENGYRGSSVRRITTTAGVSLGLVQHHFNGRDGLIRASYRHFRQSAVMAYIAEAKNAGPDPARRLEAFARTILLRRADAGRKLMKTWISFLEPVISDPEVSAIQSEVYDIYVQELSQCVEQMFANRGEPLDPEAVRKLAIGIYSLLDGLWLECALNPSRMTPDEALEIALDLIGTRLGVSCGAALGDGSP